MSAGSTGPLSDRDVHSLAGALARGEQPKVALIADHAGEPAGAKGVITGHDPGADEPFTVQFGDREFAVPAVALTVVPRTRAEVIARTAGDGPPADPEQQPASTPAPSTRGTEAPAASDAAPDADGEGERRRAAKTAAKAAAPRKGAKSGGEVVITLTIAGDGAMVEATHGTRKLVKGTALPVGAGHAVAQAVNIESVTAAVESVIAEHRSAKQAEADQLRARLAELEAELNQYEGMDT